MPQSSIPASNQTIANLLLRIYDIHERMIARTGGVEGLRDGAMLHAAVARPFVTFDLYPDDFDKAAALLHSLIKSHPFMDGTKRTAFAATVYFLDQLGHPRPTHFPRAEVIQFCLNIAEENRRQSRPVHIEQIAIWLLQLYDQPVSTTAS